MLPILTLLLGNSFAEEFSYTDKYKVKIKGIFSEEGWIVDTRIEALPYFICGCNNHNTRIKGPFKDVIRYYLMVAYNLLTNYQASGREDIFSEIRNNYVLR